MLARAFTSPIATFGRGWSRGLVSALAPGTFQTPSLYHQSVPGLALHHSHPAALLIRSASKAAAPHDPERPKRPASGFFRFAAAHREKHSETKQTPKQVAQAWKELNAAGKQPFEQAATAEREVYTKKFEEYKASGKLDAWKRDPALPKRPTTPFFSWAGTERNAPHLQDLKVAEQAKLLGASWKTLPEATKAPLMATYKAAVETYKAKMKAYKGSGAHQEWLKRTGRLEGIEKDAAKKQAEKDKVLAAKAKDKAKLAKIKEAGQASKEKEKEKALAAKEKVKAKLRKEKMQAAAATAAEKAKKEKENGISIKKAIKAKEAAKASQAKAKAKEAELKAKDKENAAKAKEAAAKKKAHDNEKASKAAAKAKEKLVVAKAAKGGSARATARA